MLFTFHKYCIGSIVRKFGYSGEVILMLKEGLHIKNITSDEFVKISFFVELTPEQFIPFFLEHTPVFLKPGVLRIKFDDIDSEIDTAVLLQKDVFWSQEVGTLFATSEPLVKVAPFSYKGFKLRDARDELIGQVLQVIQRPHQPLLEINDIHYDKKFLVPFHKDVLRQVNVDEKTLWMDLPEGLRFC